MEEEVAVSGGLECGPGSERYSRQAPLLGPGGQERLARSTVLIAGLGGLGSFLALHLAAAGVGRLVLVDRDVVEPSNLNRPVLYDEAGLGLPKPVLAAWRVRALNGCVEPVPLREEISGETAGRLLDEYRPDLVVDGLDNWEARLALEEAAWERGVPLVHAAVERFYGQILLVKPRETARLRDIAPGAGDGGAVHVLGPVVGAVASMEALLALRALLGDWSLAGTLLVVDLRTMEVARIPLRPGGNP